LRSLVALIALAAPAAGALSLQPGADFGIYDLVPKHYPYEFAFGNQMSLGFDMTLGIGQHLLLGVGYLRTTNDSGSPSNKLLSARVDVLLLDGPVRPYLGAGYGYLWQRLLFTWDGGTSADGEGGAGVFEAGVMLVRWPNPGTLNLCAQYVIPTFSVTNTFSPFGPEEVTAPFFLFGVKIGL
jgi:hypothetical protein